MAGTEETFLNPINTGDMSGTAQSNSDANDRLLSQIVELQRADYQPQKFAIPYANSSLSDTSGGDVRQTWSQSNPSVQPTPNTGTWRAPYGQDVKTTVTPEQQQQAQNNPNQNGGWRKPYNVDSPLVVQPSQTKPVSELPAQNHPTTNSNGGDVDPLTGKPLPQKGNGNGVTWDQPAQIPGQKNPGNNTSSTSNIGTPGNLTAKQSELAQQRQLVESRLTDMPYSIWENAFAGGIGGVFGGHTVPFTMNKLSNTIKLDPAVEPTNFREGVARYWQDNHDPRYWNRKELEFARQALDGEGGIAADMLKFHNSASEAVTVAEARAKLLQPFTDATLLADETALETAYNSVLNTQSVLRNSGKTPYFTPEEIALIEKAKDSKILSPEIVEIFNTTEEAQIALTEKAKAFKYLSDPKNRISAAADAESRLRTVSDAIEAQETLKNSGKAALFSNEEMAALQKFQSAAKAAPYSAAETAVANSMKANAGKFGTSFLKGAGIAGSIMVADHYLDKWIFRNNDANGIGDSLNSLFLPMAFMAGKKEPMPMVLTSIGALIAGKAIGASVPPGEQAKYGRYFRQDPTESFLLGGEFMLPMKAAKAEAGIMSALGESGFNWKTAALMGVTWSAFRAKNFLFQDSGPEEVKDKAWQLLADDSKQRTEGSMNSAIDKFASLGHSDSATGVLSFTNMLKPGQGLLKGAIGDDLLHIYRDQWLTKPTSQFSSLLEGNRGAAILTTAFGESRLALGTHVPTITDTPTYLLPGKNLDLGAKSAREFILARFNIDAAKKQVQDNVGQEIAGKKIDQSEIADLDKVKKRIEQDEAKIYGKHDMTDAVKELAQWGQGLNAVHLAKLEVDLRNTIAANQNSQDGRYRAKHFRDLATIYLSGAYAKKDSDPQSAAKLLGGDTLSGRQALDMTDKPRGYDGALDCIQMAKRLDPDNPDQAELEEIAALINSKLPANIQKQMNNGQYNPLQIRQ